MEKVVGAMLAWVVVLGIDSSTASLAGQAQGEKLINSKDIISRFEQGQERVKVIVNLVETREDIAAADRDSVRSLEVLHAEIGAIEASVLSTLTASEFTLRHRFENQAGFSAEVTLDVLGRLLHDPRVESIEPVYMVERHLAQGIPLMNASVARQTFDGQGVAIAIIDSGVDYNHPMLGDGGFPNSKVIGGYDFGEYDPDPFPQCDDAHGTLCAGVAAGSLGTDGDYVGGIAYGAKLYALKVTDSSGEIYSDTTRRAWDWCISNKDKDPDHPILVISTSLGDGRHYGECDWSSPSYVRAADAAVAAGITLLASSGNEGYCDSIKFPACISNVISVGAVYDGAFAGEYYPCIDGDSCVKAQNRSRTSCETTGGIYAVDHPSVDLVPSYSNTASVLDILAPSASAHTTDIKGPCGLDGGNYYSDFGGTSAACAYAAGAVASLQSAYKALTGSYLSPAKVRDLLISTGDVITDRKVNIAKPRINLGQAIFIVVDNFEDYNDHPPYEIFSTWIDGWGVPTNGSLAGYLEPDFARGEHFAETTIVHGGAQSMPYLYDSNFKHSEATMTLTQVRDWAKHAVGALSLWFYGDPSNVPERMYVSIAGSTGPVGIAYHDNPDATQIGTWTEWSIDLKQFGEQGVNLADVDKLSIGFGDRDVLQPGGSGTVYFDDIRLYPLRERQADVSGN